MKNFLLGLAAFTLTLTGSAQEPQEPFVCGTDALHQHLLRTDPGYAQRRAEYEAEIQQLIQNNLQHRDDGLVLTIPVVFHVLHMGGPENISDAQIHDQLAILNRDFRNLHPELPIAIQHFQNISGDVKLEFVLPTIDPIGNCTNGIDRIFTVETLHGRLQSKLRPWPRARYMNVWVTDVVQSLGGGNTLAYATKPGSYEGFLQIFDGIMIGHRYLGGVGTDPATGQPFTSGAQFSTTLTHEVGHYFNLDHPWGSTNNPEVQCGDDGVQDTPITRGHWNCQNRYDYQCSSTPIASTYDFSGVTAGGGVVDPTAPPVATAAQEEVVAILGFSSMVAGDGGPVDVTPQPVIYIQGIAGEAMIFEPFTAVGVSTTPLASNEFAFNNWAMGPTPEDKYYELTYHPQPRFGFTSEELRFAIRRSLNGPRRFSVRMGPDFAVDLPLTGIGTNLQIQNGNIGIINDGFVGWLSNVTADISGPHPNAPVTLRIYGWDADDEAGVMAINNVEVIGNIYHESLDLAPFTAVGVSGSSLVAGEFAFSNWQIGAEDGLTDPSELLHDDPDGSQYYEVTIAPKVEIAMNAQTVSFAIRRSADGPRSFAIRRAPWQSNLTMTAQMNPGVLMLSNNRGFFVNDEATDWITILANIGSTTPEEPITLRIYAWNAESEEGIFSIDNVTINGTFGIIENVENYMEYSFCGRMFTEGQSERMRAALHSPVGQRSSLWSVNTLQQVGVAEGYQVDCAPIADFYAVPGTNTSFYNVAIPYPRLTCSNTDVMFRDNSGGGVATSWSWTFQDGEPATSTDRNPIVSFSQPGWKQVTLTVGNAIGEHTKVAPFEILIGSPEVAMAGLGTYSFEQPNIGTWPFIFENYEANHTQWQRYDLGGHTGNACLYLNAGDRNQMDWIRPDNSYDYDDLISPLLDLSGVQNATLSFWYSYSTQTTVLANATERLQIQRSTDCGRTWTNLAPELTGANLITNGNSTTPGSWQMRTINLTSASLTNNVRFRWRFISSEFSNHLFIDDINIGGPVGMDDLDGNRLMSVYPNPTNDHFYVRMTGMDVLPTEVTVTDRLGAIVYQNIYGPQGGEGIVISSQALGIAEGLYVIRASNDDGTSTQKLMVGR